MMNFKRMLNIIKHIKEKEKTKRVFYAIMAYAYIPLSIAYMEILLRLLCGYDFLPGLHYALIFSFSIGFAISSLSIIVPNRAAGRAITCVLFGFCCLVFCFEYFMFSAYKVFMSIDTIFYGFGHVMGDFKNTIFITIIKGMPVIAAFFLPFAIYLFLTRKRFLNKRLHDGTGKRLRMVSMLAYLFAVAVICQMIIVNTNGRNKEAYFTEFNFDSSSRRLGIITGLALDIRYGIYGNPSTDAVFVMSSQMPEQFAPEPRVQPQSQQPQGTRTVQTTPQEPVESAESIIEEEPPIPIEYGYNQIDFDFETINANEYNARVRSINEYIASLNGSKQSEYTGIFEGKNLIIITAEAFAREVVDPVMTPTLYRLVRNGFYFSDYYQPAWGGSTSSGEYSVLMGIAPVAGSLSILRAARQNLSFLIGNKLKDKGYFTASYHNGSHTFYNRDETHTYLGYETFTAFGNGMEGHVPYRWTASDRDMMEFSVPHYIDNQPFSVYYMTVSGHATYSPAYNAMSEKNWNAFEEQYSQMSSTIRAYMACNLELEYALEYIVESLEAAGIADDTVIALSTDHYPYGLDWSESWGTDREYLSELFGHSVRTMADRDHSALILWSGSLENEHKDLAVEIASPTFSLDILPTLLNLFGLEFDSRLFAGRDVFSDAEPLVFWLDRSWKTDYGYYHAPRGEFTPEDGYDVPDEYVEWIKAVVNNKINYSDAVTSYDYFSFLFNPDGTVRTYETELTS